MTLINQYVSLPFYGLVVDTYYQINPYHTDYIVKSPTYNNERIHVSSSIIDTSASFSGIYTTTEKCNKHQLAEKLVFSNGTVFTVEFEKQDKSIRKLVGYLSSTDTLLGYSNVVDLELLVKENDLSTVKRVVYHNKLISIVINNVKYKLK